MDKDLVYGIHPVREALEAGRNFDKVLVKSGLKGEKMAVLIEALRSYRIPVQKVPEERLNRLTRKNHQGIVALLSPVPFYPVEEVVPQLFEQGKNPFFIVLDGITDVRNFGAIARSALGAGVDALIIPARNAARVNPDAVKTSAGALHKMTLCRVFSLRDTIWFLKNSGIKVIAAAGEASENYFEQDLTAPVALMLGAEENGIALTNLKAADVQVKIPLQGNLESLNVSAAAAVLAYEVVKQRILEES